MADIDTSAQLPAALLWDFDGTTVDSEGSWERAELRWLEHLGGPRPGVAVERVVGASLDHIIAWTHELSGAPVTMPTADERRAIIDMAIEEYRADGPVVLPGVRELMDAAAAQGIPSLLVSANETWMLREILSDWDEIPYLHLVGEDQVERSKPAPDIYLHACSLVGVDPRDCIAFEDSGTGTTAAVTAGCFTVGVTGDATAAIEGVGMRRDGVSSLTVDELLEAWRAWRG